MIPSPQEYLRSIYRRLDCVACAGQVSFSQSATQNPGVASRNGSGYAAFILGLASVSNFNYSADIAFQWPYYAAYIQDDYKVTKKLTINIGLRYDLNIPKQERNRKEQQPVPDLCQSRCGRPARCDAVCRRGALPIVLENAKNAWGPRLGIAYQLTPKTVIRTGEAITINPRAKTGTPMRVCRVLAASSILRRTILPQVFRSA